MSRQITQQTTLDNLKKEAKRWLKELRVNKKEARARLVRANPKALARPVLRDVQHAIALEYGLSGWVALSQAVNARPASDAHAELGREQLVERFLEYACPDHHVRGGPAHRMAAHAAMRILQQHPEITRESLYTAAVCGELEEVERILRDRPEAVREKSSVTASDRSGVGGAGDLFKDLGPKGWEPLLYLCFTRLPLSKANDNAPAIARLLLDHGASANAQFMAGDSRYTPLTGVIGEGEEDRPPHPARDALTRLLLERGAEPYDGQVIYNIHFHGRILWYMKLMYEFALKAGRKADWDDPEWHMLDQGGYGSGARWHLWVAVEQNDLELAEWCLSHGASPNAAPARDKRFSQRSLYEAALLLGRSAMVELLAHYGAKRTAAAFEGEDAFVAACFRLDRAEAQTQIENHPEYLRSPLALHAAAKQDRTDVVEFLLDLGVSPDTEDPARGNQRALHVAAYGGSELTTALLIKRGAKIDPVDSMHDATPLWFAMWGQQTRIITLLSRYSRDVWALSFTGNVERVREVLRAEPRIATMSGESTPLFWLPEDEGKAVEIVELFLAQGADASFRRKEDGLTAAQVAQRRGLDAAAERLATAEGEVPRNEPLERASPEVAKYERLAHDIVTAYATGDDAAMQRINEHYGRSSTVDDLRAMVWRLVYKVRQAGGSAEAFGIAEAQEIISRTQGFPNWTALTEAVAKGAPPPGFPYTIDNKKNIIAPQRNPAVEDWDTIIAVMKEHRISALESNGMMTDEVLKRIAELDFVTSMNLGGSRGLSDDGLLHLAEMPQLQHLNLTGGKLTDRGLQVLRHLSELRTFEMTWQHGITDAAIANLKDCLNLEAVNLMGSTTGDGAIQALRGKPNLRRLDTGRLVTDAGLELLHDYPMFKTWHGDNVAADSEEANARVPRLLIDGPFTNRGLANLSGLEGVFELDLFWHVTNITSEGFACLVQLPNLSSLGCDGRLSDNEAMRHIASMPRLRRLRAQESVATDDGFVALSRSRTIEFIWGRECPNFGGRGFVALSQMPVLRGLGIGCANVDDASLSTLPQFSALRELTPIGVKEDGFRHIGRCERLERLSCMYCRDTTDIATGHIAGLRLKSYYAGLTQITDRSLEILGKMTSLEVVELFETKSITDAGLAHLTKLPRLRQVDLSGLPNVTLAGTKVFAAHVKVNYNV